MNGFFYPVEWIPVVSSAFAVSFLLVPFLMEATRRFLMLCAAVLGVQALVGLIGFGLHLRAVFRQPGPTFFEQLLTGAPPMAPLLFPNLVILALIGLWALGRRLPSRSRDGQLRRFCKESRARRRWIVRTLRLSRRLQVCQASGTVTT